MSNGRGFCRKKEISDLRAVRKQKNPSTSVNGGKIHFFTITYYFLPPEIRVGELKVKSEKVIDKK